eukprot:8397767-Ditylum_brightwellii.AAC.1
MKADEQQAYTMARFRGPMSPTPSGYNSFVNTTPAMQQHPSFHHGVAQWQDHHPPSSMHMSDQYQQYNPGPPAMSPFVSGGEQHQQEIHDLAFQVPAPLAFPHESDTSFSDVGNYHTAHMHDEMTQQSSFGYAAPGEGLIDACYSQQGGGTVDHHSEIQYSNPAGFTTAPQFDMQHCITHNQTGGMQQTQYSDGPLSAGESLLASQDYSQWDYCPTSATGNVTTGVGGDSSSNTLFATSDISTATATVNPYHQNIDK